MCGRTACALEPDEIKNKCVYYNKDGTKKTPNWKLDEYKYKPGHNVAPQSFCPILINSNHLKDAIEEDERVLTSMRWGLVPTWMSTEGRKMSFNMNNARSDTMLEKRTYKVPLLKGQRCVVLAEGFYEWKTNKEGKKQPYFIYMPKEESKGSEEKSKISEEESKGATDENSTENKCREDENSPRPLLAMAGIFEKAFVDDEDLYSFTVITVDSHETFSWLHHRQPAILESDAEINAWLDYKNVSLEEAVKLIKPKSCLEWHPVAKYVSNSRNQGLQCRDVITEEEVKQMSVQKLSSSAANMRKWLTSSASPKQSDGATQKEKSKRSNNNIERWFSKKPKK